MKLGNVLLEMEDGDVYESEGGDRLYCQGWILRFDTPTGEAVRLQGLVLDADWHKIEPAWEDCDMHQAYAALKDGWEVQALKVAGDFWHPVRLLGDTIEWEGNKIMQTYPSRKFRKRKKV